MYKTLYIIFFSLIVTNCSFKPTIKHHGVPYLENKQNKLFVNKTNVNDIKRILGNPQTKSKFDKDIWIYIERKQTQSELKKLGKMKILQNNVLVLDINNLGILEKKTFYTKEDMEELKVVEATTEAGFKRNSFIYDFMSSMRQKINDPLGQRAKKRKKITQR